jgi:uncharacterized membrane protein
MNQQPYQQMPYQPQPQPPNPNQTSLGMDGNLAAMLGYIIVIFAIIVLATEKENRFARFHALQAILSYVGFLVLFFGLFILIFVAYFFVMIIGASLGEGGAIIAAILSIILMLLWFVLVLVMPLAMIGEKIYSAVNSYNGKWFKLPIIGNLSAKWLGIQIP